MIPAFFYSFIVITLESWMFSSFQRNRFNQSLSLLIFLVSVFLNSLVCIKQTTVSASILILILYSLLQFEGENKKITTFCIFYGLLLSSMWISNILCKLFNFTAYLNPFFLFVMSVILIYMEYMVIRLSLFFKQTSTNEKAKVIILIPVIVVLFALLLPFLQIKAIYSLLLYFVFLVLSLVIVENYISSILFINKEHEKKLSKYMETSSQNKYDLLNQQYRSSFNLLHEIMHKCSDLSLYMKEKKYEQVENELNYMCDATFREFNNIYSNSVVFNTLLANRKDLLQKYEIQIHSTIEFNNFDFISFSNQVDLFNTLLDFVLEEAVKSNTNRVVFIKSNMLAKQVILSFRFANNKNKNLQNEVHAALDFILNNYDAILSINEIDENTASLLLVFPKIE